MKAKIAGQFKLELPEFRAEFFKSRPDWEKQRLVAMREVIKPGMKVLDVGAEQGDFTALFSQWVGDTGEIYAFEPVAKMWPTIRAIFKMNNLPTPYCWFGFLGDENKNDGVLINDWPDEALTDELIPDPGFQFLSEQDALPIIKLDELNLEPDLITMDTEGSEFEIINGGIETIKKYKPILFISVHRYIMKLDYHKDADDLIKLLEGLGYKAEMLFEDHEEHWRFLP